jgi:hypothetical protein
LTNVYQLSADELVQAAVEIEREAHLLKTMDIEAKAAWGLDLIENAVNRVDAATTTALCDAIPHAECRGENP